MLQFYKDYGKNMFKNIIVPLKFEGSFKFISLVVKHQFSKNFKFPKKEYEVLNFQDQSIILSRNLGDIATFLEVFNLNEYATIFKLVSRKKIKPFTLVDLGANIGLVYVFFNKLNLVENYIGVEPLEENIKLLNFNTFSPNSKIINKAVWIHNKGVSFSNHGTNNSNSVNIEGKEKIDSITLEEVLKENYLNIFLKMDIEGAEYSILDKDLELFEKKVRYFAIEFHDIKKNNYHKFVENLSKNFEIIESIKEDVGFSLVFGVNKNI